MTRNANGVHCQVWIAITEISASCGSPSQLWLPRPSARVATSTRPTSGASTSVRQNRPTTTGASTIGRIAATRRTPWPRGMRITSSASASPIATCSTTVERRVDDRQRQRAPEARVARHLRVVVDAGEARQPRHRQVDALQAGPRQVDERRRRRQHQQQQRRQEQREREAPLLLRQRATEAAIRRYGAAQRPARSAAR